MMFPTRNAAYVPSFANNLLSLNSVTDNGYFYVDRRDSITVHTW